jgi:hypothetical protein
MSTVRNDGVSRCQSASYGKWTHPALQVNRILLKVVAPDLHRAYWKRSMAFRPATTNGPIAMPYRTLSRGELR